ncbi:MAG TPA: DUF2946 domain-containing protein [Azoarcus taiwanensis]|nr:DUF2946 domain-containing protein [Azoarcus taiwanensis]
MSLHRTRRYQRLASWIATFAIVLATVAPTVSQAMVASGMMGDGWVEVCTSQGMRWVAVGDETPSDVPAEYCHGACAYCFTHAGSFGLVPGFDPPASLHEEHAERLTVRCSTPLRASGVWSSHLTRAPPLSA